MERAILLSIALPGVIAALFMIAAAVLAPTANGQEKRAWRDAFIRSACGALALGIGVVLNFFLIERAIPTIPPQHRWHWLAIMAAAAAIIGMVHGLWARTVIGTMVTGALLAISAGLLLHPLPGQDHHYLWKLGLGLAVALTWFAINPLAQRRPGHLVPLTMMIVFVAASIVLVESRSAKFGQMAGALACMSGAIMAVGFFARKTSLAGGAMAVMTTLLPAWMMTGRFYDVDGNVPALSFVLVAAAPLGLWIGELPRINRLGGATRWLLRIVSVLLVCGAAVAMALLMGPPPFEEYQW